MVADKNSRHSLHLIVTILLTWTTTGAEKTNTNTIRLSTLYNQKRKLIKQTKASFSFFG
jgi:hypothetical protein